MTVSARDWVEGQMIMRGKSSMSTAGLYEYEMVGVHADAIGSNAYDIYKLFSTKVPENAEVVVGFRINSSGASEEDSHGNMRPTYFCFASGTALIRRKG